MKTPARSVTSMHYAIALLMGVTIGLIAWHRYGMERVVDVTTWANARLEAADDHFMGGDSKVALERHGRTLTLRCQLSRKIEWPGCKYMFLIGDGVHGLDLSEFDAVSFDVSYRSAGRHTLRSMLFNFEPKISRADDAMSQKINETEFEVPADGGHVRIPLKVYHTATWWIDYKKVPLDETDMRLDNVTRVELLTGSVAEAGEHVVELRALRFHGKWIGKDALYGGLLAAWIACAVAWPLLSALRLRRELRETSARVALLSQINAALQLEARELVEQANTDPLTGALNRQGLRAALMNNASLLASPMAVLFADIDHFKRINDQHGHDVGDAVLRDFATTMQRGIRSNDKLVRWGGEEFLIVCPATTAEQAGVLAEKLRLSLHARTWAAGLSVTASFGVAAREQDEDIGGVINRADAALYEAKAAGRDRVVVAGLLPRLAADTWVVERSGAQYD